jgi:hypothetical protein
MQTEKEIFQQTLAKRSRRLRPEVVTAIGDLTKRFAAFRRENPRHTRIPGGLRAAVLAAMQRGVTPTRLRRTCGLSKKQLTCWQGSSWVRTPSFARVEPARVFSVVGETPLPRAAAAAVAGAEELELRLGRWSVSVRLAEERAGERG